MLSRSNRSFAALALFGLVKSQLWIVSTDRPALAARILKVASLKCRRNPARCSSVAALGHEVAGQGVLAKFGFVRTIHRIILEEIIVVL